MTHFNIASLEVGQEIGKTEFLLTRDSLVRYAGASGDFNQIHYRDDVAHAVGLPGVLAHGMLTMGVAVQVAVDWVGDAGKVAAMTEQVLWQRSGFALILLNAEMRDEDEDETEAVDRRWQGRL